MAQMSTGDLKALLASEKSAALSAMASNKLSAERERAMSYYNGDVSQDLPSLEGRSSAVSFDVSDTIEGLMPQLMEIFTAGERVVEFAPVGPEDEAAAAQETDYINHVFMQQNPGFLVLYSFIKDALLSKVGVVKVRWSEEEKEEKQTYYDLDDMQLAMLLNDPEVEIVEHTVKDYPGGEDDDEASGAY